MSAADDIAAALRDEASRVSVSAPYGRPLYVDLMRSAADEIERLADLLAATQAERDETKFQVELERDARDIWRAKTVDAEAREAALREQLYKAGAWPGGTRAASSPEGE